MVVQRKQWELPPKTKNRNLPGTGTPGACEEEDIDTDKGHESRLSGTIAYWLASSNSSYDELAGSHTNGSEQEQWTATPFLYQIQTGES